MKIFFWVILIFIAHDVIGQNVVFKYEKKFRQGTAPKSYHSYIAVDDSTGEIHLTIVDNKSIERFIVDSNWHIKKHFDEVRGAYAQFPYDRFNSLQMVNTSEGELNIYNTQGKKFDINVVDYSKNEEANISKFELEKHEFITACFATKDAYCLVVSNNKSKDVKLITNIQSKGSKLEAISVGLNFPDLEELPLNKQLQDIAVLGENERDLEKLVAKKKIYVFENSVVFTADETDATYLTAVDLNTQKVKHQIFIQQFAGKFPKKNQTQICNSFLLDNILVNGNVYNGNLSISFYDITKGSLIKNYAAYFKDSINFKNGLLYNKKDKAIDAEDFIDRIIKTGQLAFDLSEKGADQYELIVQNCDIKKANKFSSGGFMMPGGSINTPDGTVALPSTFRSTGFWGEGDVAFKKDVYFFSILNKADLEHIKNANEAKSKSAMLEDELLDLNEKNALSLFKKNGISYLGFYDDKAEAFIIKQIGN